MKKQTPLGYLDGFESWTSTSQKNRLDKMKKKKILVKIQDFKMHYWQHSAGENSQRRHPQHLRDSKCHKMSQTEKTSTKRLFKWDG